MNKRRRPAEMATLTIAVWVFPVTTTKRGGPHVSLFIFKPWSKVQNIEGIEAEIRFKEVLRPLTDFEGLV